MMSSINNIDIKINGKSISITPDNLKKFYIANLDDDGNETNYLYNIDTNSLFANFLILSIKKEAHNIIDILTEDKCITSLDINFVNGRKQAFELPKNRIISYGEITNKYEEIIESDDEDLCILISNLNLRNKKALFI